MIKAHFEKLLYGKKGDFTLRVNSNFEELKIHAIFGESGSGKSSILKILSGIMRPDHGTIEVFGEYFFNSNQKINLSIWKRQIGFVFQNPSLFPHLNVYNNIVFSKKNMPKNKIYEIIEILDLCALLKHKPTQLSGGQAQKVVLARTLVSNPKILLLDEPFSSLDLESRLSLQLELKNILSYFKLTTLLISHDPSEIILLSDLLHHLQDGNLKDPKPPKEFFKSQINNPKALILKIEATKHKTKLLVLVQNTPLMLHLEEPMLLKEGQLIELENLQAQIKPKTENNL